MPIRAGQKRSKSWLLDLAQTDEDARIDLEDLGPVIGARPGSVKQAALHPQDKGCILPNLPFNTNHWDSVDADVQLRAKTLAHAKALPLENLQTHLRLRDAVLTLDPLNFGLAGGQLKVKITLDGRKPPNQAHALVRARKVQLAKLFPTLDLGKTSIGQVNGEFDLTVTCDSVGRMLASSNGKLSLVVSNGQISRLMMEKAGLPLWEIFRLSLTGDKPVHLRCAVADFEIKQGTMRAEALVLDTEVTTLFGTGSINLVTETLDLALDNHTKTTSPLVDAGPGQDSDCGQLVRDARVWKRRD